jgi:hypothetical protein
MGCEVYVSGGAHAWALAELQVPLHVSSGVFLLLNGDS